MTKLNVILSFAAAVAMALTTFDTVNAASLRSEERFLASFAIDSTKGERLLFGMDGNENAENDAIESTGSNSIPASENADNAENAEETDSNDSTDVERFLVEMDGRKNAAAEYGERFNGARFLADAEDGENEESDDSSDILAGASVDAVDSSNVDAAGSSNAVGSSNAEGDRFLMEMDGNENAEDDAIESTEDDSNDSNKVDVESSESVEDN